MRRIQVRLPNDDDVLGKNILDIAQTQAERAERWW